MIFISNSSLKENTYEIIYKSDYIYGNLFGYVILQYNKNIDYHDIGILDTTYSKSRIDIKNNIIIIEISNMEYKSKNVIYTICDIVYLDSYKKREKLNLKIKSFRLKDKNKCVYNKIDKFEINSVHISNKLKDGMIYNERILNVNDLDNKFYLYTYVNDIFFIIFPNIHNFIIYSSKDSNKSLKHLNIRLKDE